MLDPLVFRLMNEIAIIDQLGTTLFERAMPHGLTVPQFSVLNQFAKRGGERSPLELAAAFQVTKATMSSTLQRLEAKGFVVSTPDPSDGRAKRIAMTAAGRAARDEAIAALARDLAAIEKSLGGAEIRAIIPFLIKLRAFLDQRRNDT
jgi:DNA-binding MarR family transcriptional regulator